MRVPFLQVDAFASAPLRGNPAAVMHLPHWLPDATLQAIAAENNLSETAFLVDDVPGVWHLRWFTPTTEVDLCGHATLGAAFAVKYWGRGRIPAMAFRTLSGVLTVVASGDRLHMDFPAVPITGPLDDPALVAAIGVPIRSLWGVREVHGARYALAETATESTVRAARPDLAALASMSTNVILTAPGDAVDVASRFFAPASGVPEDPVTGSAHCTLAGFWAERLGKTALHCRQVSTRGGDVWTEVDGDRVQLSGTAVPYLEGIAMLP